MAKYCWILLSLLVWPGSWPVKLWAAPTKSFLVKGWTTDEAPNVVFCMTHTRDGYLWLGTGIGLARFDGVKFKFFDEDQAPELNGHNIVKLFEDTHRNLWIATADAGVWLVDSAGKFTKLPLGDPGQEGPLVNICEDTAGSVWFSMAKGLVYHYVQGRPQIVVQNCRGLMADNSGLVWIGALDGKLLGLGPVSNSAPNAIPVPYELPAAKLDYLLASKRGGYWRLANGRVEKWKTDHLEKDLGPYPWATGVPILTAAEDLEGNLIVGTGGQGVYWFDADGQGMRVPGVSHDTIFCVLVDREGSLWVGTNGGGLNRVNRQNFDVLEGTEGTTVQSVCPDAQGGVWIGYHGERVDHWTTNGLERFTSIWPEGLPAPPGIIRIYIQTVFEDQGRQLWAGGSSTMTPRLCLFTLQDRRFLPVLSPAALSRDPAVLFGDRHGLLWLGSQSGLACWDKRMWKVFTTRDGLSSDSVRAIAEDHQGNLWVGTESGGLNRLHDGAFTIFRKQPKDGLPGDEISSLYVDAEDVLWVGTAGGLARYDHGHWTRYTTHEGLASNRIGYLLEDTLQNLWLGSTAGLMRVPKQSLNEVSRGTAKTVACRTFGKADGLPSGECTVGSQPGACRTPDGTLWFPTIKGLVVVNPSRLKPNSNPPPVVIEEVLVNNQPQNVERLRAPQLATLTIPAGKENLEIHFASLNLSAPEKGFFKYYLENHEHDWTEVDAQSRYARYPRLPHGHYRFHVKACNEDGLWNETPASLDITVLPPFWQTWWFVTVSTILLLAWIVLAVHYVSTQKLQRQLAAMRQQEALERERARIARDLHDQLGANLTQVALLGELAETDKNQPGEVVAHARQIAQTARETTRALDEIVWTVNPSNDTLDGLVNYLCKYAQDYLGTAGLRYRLEIPAQLPGTPISPELRHNVFLAAKEAINNIVKHARASSVWVRLTLQPGRFVLELEDNGRGLSPADQHKGRNGLRNMRKRMEEVGGQFDLVPGEQGGTRVKLTAPLRGSPTPGVDGEVRDT